LVLYGYCIAQSKLCFVFLPQNTTVTASPSETNPLFRVRRGRRYEVVVDDVELMEFELVRSLVIHSSRYSWRALLG
jgi:hypothetical protein